MGSHLLSHKGQNVEKEGLSYISIRFQHTDQIGLF
jgi:hypothetical protein